MPSRFSFPVWVGLGLACTALVLEVSRVNGDHIEFEVTVRGDSDRLMRAMRGSRILQPITGTQLLNNDPLALPGYRREPDLAYMLVPSP